MQKLNIAGKMIFGESRQYIHSISLCFRDKDGFCVLPRNSKWPPNDFWEKSPVDSADTMWVKNLIEIALSRSVSEINLCLCLTQKFKMATKRGGKRFLEKVASRL